MSRKDRNSLRLSDLSVGVSGFLQNRRSESAGRIGARRKGLPSLSRYCRPASPPAQVGKCFELAFSAADLPPVQFDPRRAPGVEKGIVFLRDYLANGPRKCREIQAAGQSAGISPNTIRKAARRLGICFDGKGTWVLPG